MTDLNKPVTRRSATLSPERHPRPIIITLMPSGTIVLRESGRRKCFEIPLRTAYQYGAQLEADAKRAERKAAKKNARK